MIGEEGQDLEVKKGKLKRNLDQEKKRKDQSQDHPKLLTN